MYPVPHVLLILPICVFTGLFVAALAVNLVVAAISRPRPVRRGPYWQAAARRRAVGRAAIGRAATGAQIIYFTPRKSALPSNFSLGAR